MTTLKLILFLFVLSCLLALIFTVALYIVLYRKTEKRRKEHKINIKKAIYVWK